MKKNLIITLGLLPVAAVWFGLLTDNIEWLGADPIQFITTYSGQIAVYFLIATLQYKFVFSVAVV